VHDKAQGIRPSGAIRANPGQFGDAQATGTAAGRASRRDCAKPLLSVQGLATLVPALPLLAHAHLTVLKNCRPEAVVLYS
jgi:hypothetical protein